MQRYLLFDSGCSLCTSIARQVEDASDSRLAARSLRDPDVRSILDEVKPGWRWEPMLLEVDDERRRVYAGVGMRARLVQVLGPRRALAVAQVGQHTDDRARSVQAGRRRFLQTGGKLAGLGFFLSWVGRPLRLQGASIQSHPLSRQQNLQPPGLGSEEDSKIRTDTLRDPSVHYLYTVTITTGAALSDTSILLPNAQILGYMQEYDVYVVQLDLKARPQFGNSLFLPFVSGESNSVHAETLVTIAKADREESTNSSERRLVAAYSASQNKVLATFVIESEVIGTSYKGRTDITLKFADRAMTVRIDKQQSDQPYVVSHQPVSIDQELASRFRYDYDRDPSLIWYHSQLGRVEASDGQVCSLVCDTIFVAVCGLLASPLCVAVGIVVCSMSCSPKCVGEGC